MENSLDYKTILNNVAVSILVASPVYEESKIVDFTVTYVNNSFIQLTQNILNIGENYKNFVERLSPDVPFFDIAIEALTQNITKEYVFYSEIFSKWLKLTLNPVDKSIALTLTDITKAKNYENALTEQNKQLENLTEELTQSHADLDNQIKSIQTLNEQLMFAAYHDSLTNLYNRAWLTSNIRECIRDSEITGGKFGLILIDIDNMKDINDSRGHHAGDETIRQVATIFRLMESRNFIPTRFGGDEFIVLCKNIINRSEIEKIAKKTLSLFNAEEIHISGGITLYPDDTSNPEDLLKFADMAKTEVKRNGKNNVKCFQTVMQDKFLKKINIETKLSKATADKIFQLYYQPQFTIKTGKLRGFEALLRWHDEELGWISPEQFIPLAEETRLVIPIGDWVIQTALNTLAIWEKDYNFDGQISINVSPLQFKQPDFMNKLKTKIEKSGVQPSHVEIEITEGMLIENVEETVLKLNEIKSMGLGISLDDFGTGYSSLRYLQILPLTTLKIDKSFIRNITESDGVEANITESIINMVSRMGLDTIAEGVETEGQLEALKEINCKIVQGFLKGKPMPRINCEKMLSGDESAILKL